MKLRNLLAAGVFILLVVVSGVGLAAAGNVSLGDAHEHGPRAGGELARAGAGGIRPTAGEMPTGGQNASTSIDWSAIGSVFGNIWTLFAITASVMVISWPINAIRQRLKRRNPHPTQPAPAA